MSENFAQLLQEFSFDINEGEIIDAVITDVKRDKVVVDIGFKGESTIDKAEFLDMNGKFHFKSDDSIKVLVEKLDNGEGEIVLSYAKAKEIDLFSQLENAFKNNLTVSARVERTIPSGLIVSLDGIPGFLPSSLIERNKVFKDEQLYQFLHKVIDVKIIKMDMSDPRKSGILVSRKATSDEYQENPKDLLARLEKGSIVEGHVKNITEYGVFVDLGGIDGLLHITDISWSRIENPNEKFKVGEKITLKVSKVDREKERISLSVKALDESPWTSFVDNHKVGDVIDCRVVKTTEYGAFVIINENLDGLIHNTEIAWGEKNPDPSDYFDNGEIIKARVIEIDHDKSRVSLSFKRTHDNPWDDFAKTHQIGDTVSGTVKSVNDFGVTVTLENGCEAVVPTENLSWNPRERFSTPKVNVGDKIKGILKVCDPIREKIQLSVRDFSANPLVEYSKSNPEGSVVEGKIVDISNKNLTVQLGDNVFGMVKSTEAGIAPNDSLKNLFKVDEVIRAKNLGLNGQFVNLSIRELIK